MQPDNKISRGVLDDLSAFAVVARERSFSRAAAELEVSNSMLSYTIKRLENRLGYPLLRRTSRRVAATDEGARLLSTLEPAFKAIKDALHEQDRTRDHVSGTLRITATRQGYEAVIRRLLAHFQAMYPAATVEIIIDYAFRDLIAEGFDAGIRLGEKLQEDMVAVAVGPELRMAVVASPDYLARKKLPVVPEDLHSHRCINYRMVSANTLYAWEFERNDRRLKIGVSGPLTFNEPDLMLQAAIEGNGIAYVLAHEAAAHIADGRLIRLLEDWTPPFPGFFLYYPSRKQVSQVLAAFLTVLRTSRT